MDYSRIIDAFLPKIGWRQNPNPNNTKLVDLFTSTSGLYYNDAHPLLTFRMLEALVDDESITYPTYAGGTTYYNGDIVTESGTDYIYINQTASAGNTPPNTTYWREYEVLTETLRRETEAGIVKCIDDWRNIKQILGTADNLLDNEYMVKVTGNVTDTVTKESKIRFIEITPLYSTNMIFEPYKIGLQFTVNESIPIKIFKSGQLTPILDTTYAYTGGGSMQWFDLDLDMDSGFKYWICYDEDAITGQAINGVEDYGYIKDYQYFPTGRFYQAVGGYHTQGISQLWNLTQNSYSRRNNYGINLKINVKCDYTQFIIDQADNFLNAIKLSVATLILRKIALNPEAKVNRYENNISHKDILYEIDGDSQGNSKVNRNLKSQYERAIMAIQFDTSSIDRICLPCRRRGLKHRTI